MSLSSAFNAGTRSIIPHAGHTTFIYAYTMACFFSDAAHACRWRGDRSIFPGRPDTTGQPPSVISSAPIDLASGARTDPPPCLHELRDELQLRHLYSAWQKYQVGLASLPTDVTDCSMHWMRSCRSTRSHELINILKNMDIDLSLFMNHSSLPQSRAAQIKIIWKDCSIVNKVLPHFAQSHNPNPLTLTHWANWDWAKWEDTVNKDIKSAQ